MNIVLEHSLRHRTVTLRWAVLLLFMTFVNSIVLNTVTIDDPMLDGTLNSVQYVGSVVAGFVYSRYRTADHAVHIIRRALERSHPIPQEELHP